MQGAFDGASGRREVVGEDAVARGHASRLADSGDQGRAVRVADLGRGGRSGGFDDFVPGNDDAHSGRSPDRHDGNPDGGENRQMRLRDSHTAVQQNHAFGGLGTTRHNVLSRDYRRFDENVEDVDDRRLDHLRPLNLNDRIGALGHGGTRHDPHRFARPHCAIGPHPGPDLPGKPQPRVCRSDVFGSHGKPIHGRAMKRGEVTVGDARLSEYPRQGALKRNALGRKGLGPAQDGLPGLVNRDHLVNRNFSEAAPVRTGILDAAAARCARSKYAGRFMSATRHVFENGLTLLVEPVAQVHSVAIAVFVRRGSRHESDREHGLAHFIEHLVFKGTASRSAEQIAMDVDSMGGHMDAFTSKEYAAFHLRVLDSHLERVAAILSDILVNPRFDQADLAKEKTVILEEFAMVDDTPDDIVTEMFAARLWPDHPLGRPILGTRPALKAYTQVDVRRFFKKVYVPSNLVLAIAGRITEKRAVELATRLFAPIPHGQAHTRNVAPRAHHGLVKKHKDTLSQTHLCLGSLGPSSLDANRFVGHVVGTVLGGSISSRLFQNVREKRGLVYSISSGLSGFVDTGCFSIYAATAKERIDRVLSLIGDEAKRLADEKVPAEELQRAKDNLKGGMMLSLEGSGSRMGALARAEIYHRRTVSTKETLRSIDAVTSDQVQGLAREIFAQKMTLAVIGNLKGAKLRIPSIE